MKTPDKTKKEAFDAERFIKSAEGTPTPSRSRRQRTTKPDSKAKPAAEGYTRATFDLPDDLHTRLKVAAALDKSPMRDVLEEALEAWLGEKER